jgi:FkbM family methyltransferase
MCEMEGEQFVLTPEGTVANPNLTVYGFEPNLKLAGQRMGVSPNFVVLPFAIAKIDGAGEFHLNSCDQASSLLSFNRDGLSEWIGTEQMKIERVIVVPTIRLDTFMNEVGIRCVDFLRIDAQGADLSVLKSAGERLRDVWKIVLEVSLTHAPLYEGSHSKEECLRFMTGSGFTLLDEESQSGGQEANLTFISASSGGHNASGLENAEATKATPEPTRRAAGGR